VSTERERELQSSTVWAMPYTCDADDAIIAVKLASHAPTDSLQLLNSAHQIGAR
jgi:hypothetical protein